MGQKETEMKIILIAQAESYRCCFKRFFISVFFNTKCHKKENLHNPYFFYPEITVVNYYNLLFLNFSILFFLT